MTSKHQLDLIQVLTSQDGQYNEEVGAYVTAYPVQGGRVVVELEYVDIDNEEQVIEVIAHSVQLAEDD